MYFTHTQHMHRPSIPPTYNTHNPLIHRAQSYQMYMATLLTHTISLPIEEAKFRAPFSLGQPYYPGKAQPYPSHLPARALSPGVPKTPGMDALLENCFCELSQVLCPPTLPFYGEVGQASHRGHRSSSTPSSRRCCPPRAGSAPWYVWLSAHSIAGRCC